MQGTTTKADSGKGFTLVELLVVIAIIALLLSILMPALNKVRETAKRVICATKLHQLHFAHQFYAQDNRNTYLNLWKPMPPALITSEPDFTTAEVFLVGGQQGNNHGTGPLGGGANYRSSQRVLNPYVNNVLETWHCPGDKGTKVQLTYGKSNWVVLGNSYMYNGYGNSTADYYAYNTKGSGATGPRLKGFAEHKIGSVKNPAMKILEADCTVYTFIDGTNREDEYAWHSRSFNMANIVFGDGHTSYTRIVNKDKSRTDWYQRGPDYSFLCDE